MDIPNRPKAPADAHGSNAWADAGAHLQAGHILVPYWGINQNGQRVALSCWDTLAPGETLRQASARLTAKHTSRSGAQFYRTQTGQKC